MKELNHRARKILSAVVSEYLSTGEAVGSRLISKGHGIELSPATIRNVMADLEDLGLLTQPHTSAGRVPTPTGLRLFIDSMLKVRTLSPREKEEIRQQYDLQPQAMQGILQKTSKVLSDITQYAGVVLVPNPEYQRLKHIEFVPLRDNKFLCILVTTEGLIENKIITAEFKLEGERLERIHNYLHQLLEGLTMEEVRRRVLEELGQEKNRYDQMIAAALSLSQAALADTPSGDVVVSGGANLVGLARAGDETDMTRVQELLHALEEKELLIRLLDQTMRSERVQVFLGAETAHHALGDAAVVATPYGPEDCPVGALAVIGPTRMNYSKVLSVVDFTAELITKLLTPESS